MSQLVPCPSCDRHLRLPESSQQATSFCPFCGGELNEQALGARYASRRVVLPSGSKRAALFAFGSSMAAACANVTPVYGAPVVLPSADAAATSDGPELRTIEGEGSEQAIYGAPVPPTSSADQTASAPATDGTNVPPHDGGASGADGGDTDVARDAAVNPGADASTAGDSAVSSGEDAGPGALDGGGLDALDASVGPGPEPTSVALYGGPPILN